jgi:hypothetical protein
MPHPSSAASTAHIASTPTGTQRVGVSLTSAAPSGRHPSAVSVPAMAEPAASDRDRQYCGALTARDQDDGKTGQQREWRPMPEG